MENKIVSKRDGVVKTRQIKKSLPRKKKVNKMDTISGVPRDVVENKG